MMNIPVCTTKEDYAKVRDLHDEIKSELMEKYNYNKHISWRLANIIRTACFITGLNKEVIVEQIKRTWVYQCIIEDNEVFLRECYSANLLDIVKELKEMDDVPEEMFDITSRTISIVHKSICTSKESAEYYNLAFG